MDHIILSFKKSEFSLSYFNDDFSVRLAEVSLHEQKSWWAYILKVIQKIINDIERTSNQM